MKFGEVTNTALVPFIKEGSTEVALKKFEDLKDQSAARLEELRMKEIDSVNMRKKENTRAMAECKCKHFTLIFCTLAHKKFGFTLDALKQLTEEDLKICIDKIRKTTKTRRKILKGVIFSLIPVLFIGWIIVEAIAESDVYRFEGYYQKLQKFYGEHLPYGFMQTFINSGAISERVSHGSLYFR